METLPVIMTEVAPQALAVRRHTRPIGPWGESASEGGKEVRGSEKELTLLHTYMYNNVCNMKYRQHLSPPYACDMQSPKYEPYILYIASSLSLSLTLRTS